jgi:glycopeptide antibiotics resistance protein
MNWLFDVLLYLVIPSCSIYIFIRLLFKKKYPINPIVEAIRLLSITYLNYLIFIVWLMPVATLNYLRLNLVPLKTIFTYAMDLFQGHINIFVAVTNVIGNILITLPLGILLLLSFNKVNKKILFPVALGSPIIIEFVQYILHINNFGTRSVDIDDVILNFIGIVIGFYLANLSKEFLVRKKAEIEAYQGK